MTCVRQRRSVNSELGSRKRTMNCDHSTTYENAEVVLNLEIDMQRSKTQFEALLRDESIRNLDLSKLDTKRRRSSILQDPLQVKGVSRVKLGSLECESSDEDQVDITDITPNMDSETGSKALLTYFCTLGLPNNSEDIDVEFLDMLCSFGDVNVRDIHGQSLLHEVAREWSPDIANYLVLRGIDVNAADNWGRTPLYVAVAANYAEMVYWLVKNGASVKHETTKGEGQYPIHYAAKYDAVEVFEALMQLGANPAQKDGDGRTPFFIAAETGNQRMCKCLLDWELPTASYTHRGESTIDQIICNLPTELAWRALDQFIVESRTAMNAKVKVYLSCLGKRRWRLLHQNNPHLGDKVIIQPPDPLEVIIRRQELNLINHPAILELIKLKGKRYGNKWKHLDIVLHLIFTVLWTTCASIRVNEFEEDESFLPPANADTKLIVIILSAVAQSLTIVYIYKFYIDWCGLRKLEEDEEIRISAEYDRLKQFCHPRWKNDHEILLKKLEVTKVPHKQFWSSGGSYNEVACLSLSCVYFLITLAWYILEKIGRDTAIRQTRMLLSAVFILALFLRLNRCFQSFQSLGPFISMIGESVRCGLQILFLFFEFFVPFSVACWLTFGGPLIQSHEKYETFQHMLYELWLLSFVGNYEYKALYRVSPIMTQILVSLYFLLLGIITINIYIALLSEAFARVNETASAKAYMAQAQFIQNIEITMPEYKRKLEVYMNKYCAPMEIAKDEFYNTYKSKKYNPRGLLKDIQRDVVTISETTQKIIDSDLTFKREVEEVGSKLHDFNSKYDGDKVKTFIREISTIFVGHRTPLSKAITKANNGILTFISKISDTTLIRK